MRGGCSLKKMFEMYSVCSYSLGDLEKFAHKHNIRNNFFKGRPATLLSKNVISDMLKILFIVALSDVKNIINYIHINTINL